MISSCRSGAYLFKPEQGGSQGGYNNNPYNTNHNNNHNDKNDFEYRSQTVFDANDMRECVVVSGPVFSEVTVAYENGGGIDGVGASNFVHTVRLYHTRWVSRNFKHRGWAMSIGDVEK